MKVIDFIVCDDIRREINHKYTIVGAYNKNIVFSASSEKSRWPINKQLGIFFRLMHEESDLGIDTFKFKLDIENKELAVVGGEMKIDSINKLTVFDFVLPLTFPCPGRMSVKMEFFKNNQLVLSVSPELNFSIEEHQPKT